MRKEPPFVIIWQNLATPLVCCGLAESVTEKFHIIIIATLYVAVTEYPVHEGIMSYRKPFVQYTAFRDSSAIMTH